MFKLFVSFLKDADLIAGETIAIDGTKSRAHNGKKSNFNQKKIDKHLEYIENKTQEYLSQLEQNDLQDNSISITKIQEKIERLKKNKIRYELLEEKLQASGEPQISTTDEDSRALLVQGQVVEVSYNIQVAVDDKHNLVVATQTINRNDTCVIDHYVNHANLLLYFFGGFLYLFNIRYIYIETENSSFARKHSYCLINAFLINVPDNYFGVSL